MSSCFEIHFCVSRFTVNKKAPIHAILGTSNGDDEVYLFPLEPARDPWHTARLSLPARRLEPALSLPATCDCRPADNLLLATLGARQRVSESRGAPAVPHHFERVGSRRTGCSNSHRFSSPAFPRLGCSLPLCLVSLLTRKPKFTHTQYNSASLRVLPCGHRARPTSRNHGRARR